MSSLIVKGKPLTREETKYLLDLIESSKILKRKSTNATNNRLKNAEWFRISTKFNAIATCPRTPHQIRLKWENLKKSARKRATNIRMNKIQRVHDERLNARVDDMLKRGLIGELLDFHDRHNRQRIRDGTPPDYTKGIFQTLGFKEFHEYLMLSEEKRNSEEGRKLLSDSIDNMKMATRRYARRQNKMVRSRFLEHPKREVPPIFELDTTNPSVWNENVKMKAIEIVESFLKTTTCQYKPLVSNISDEKKSCNSHSSNYCHVCNRLLVGDDIYAIHLNSNRHKKVLKKKLALAAKETEQTKTEGTSIDFTKD